MWYLIKHCHYFSIIFMFVKDSMKLLRIKFFENSKLKKKPTYFTFKTLNFFMAELPLNFFLKCLKTLNNFYNFVEKKNWLNASNSNFLFFISFILTLLTIHISRDKSSITSFQKMIFVFSDLFVPYEKEFCSELRITLKNGKVGFVSKARQCFKIRICLKMENLTLSWKRTIVLI